MSTTLERARSFCSRHGLRVPILLAPMAGASAPSLSIAVASAGGLASCGALLMQPAEIEKWAADVRAGSNGPFQLNLWIPDPAPTRDPEHESRVRDFLAGWGPAVPPEAGDATPPNFAAQCDALLAAGPSAVSSVMGLFPPTFVAELKRRRIAWFANISTVAEARAAAAAGADVIVAQGMEAGGHRGCFDAATAERSVCLRSFQRLSMPSPCRSSRQAASPTDEEWRRPWRLAPVQRKSARDSCAAPRRGSARHGRTRWPKRHPKTL